MYCVMVVALAFGGLSIGILGGQSASQLECIIFYGRPGMIYILISQVMKTRVLACILVHNAMHMHPSYHNILMFIIICSCSCDNCSYGNHLNTSAFAYESISVL